MLRGHPAHPNTTMYWSVQALQCTAPGKLSLGTLPAAAHRCLRSRLILQHSTQIPTTESTLRALTAWTQCLADPLNTNQKSNTKPIHNHYLIFPARQKESSLTLPFALRSHIRAMCGFKAKACSKGYFWWAEAGISSQGISNTNPVWAQPLCNGWPDGHPLSSMP